MIDVLDVESLSAQFDVSEIAETATNSNAMLTIERSNTDIGDAEIVHLASEDSRLVLPETVTIPAGQPSIAVPVLIADDQLSQRPDLSTIYVTADAYHSGTAALRLIDDEIPYFQNPSNRHDVDGNGNVTIFKTFAN